MFSDIASIRSAYGSSVLDKATSKYVFVADLVKYVGTIIDNKRMFTKCSP